MNANFFKNRFIVAGSVVVIFFIVLFFFSLRPASSDSAPVVFEIQHGESFHDIVHGLSAAHLIQSSFAFEILSLADGGAFHLKPGLYQLDAAMSAPAILGELTSQAGQAVTVTIPEGENIYEIDAALANALVIHPGDLIQYDKEQIAEDGGQDTLEGRLFPDTYQFARGSSIKDIVQKFLDNFQAKAAPLLGNNGSSTAAQNTLILASILEKEVPTQTDQQIVAGILQKRIAVGIPLDVDATVCYAMLQQGGTCAVGLNFKLDSPYNTYLYKGLPPAPIGNPGVQAISAALHPQSSPYWYYLSDPKTGKTIYAVTLGEQNANVRRYLNP
jgi:UPF0755 protein